MNGSRILRKGGGNVEKFDIYRDIAERTEGDIYCWPCTYWKINFYQKIYGIVSDS